MTDAASWIEARAAGAPEALRERMRAALDDVTAGDATAPALPQALADAALDRLRAVLRAPAERSAAIDLLAADALLTYACEAASERGPLELATLTGEYGADRLAGLLASQPTDGDRAPEDA